MRIASGAIQVAAYQALGAIPVTVDFSELFTALQQHSVDGIDVPINGFVTAKYYTVAKHVAMTNHNMSIVPLLAAKGRVGIPRAGPKQDFAR